MRNHFSRNKRLYILAGAAAALIATGAVVAVNSSTTSASTERITIADQVGAVASQRTPLTVTKAQIAADSTLTAQGALPIKAVSLTELTSIVDAAERTPIAVINAETRMAAAAVRNTTGYSIVVARFLDDQAEAIYTLLEEAGATVTVTGTTTAASTAAGRSGWSGYNPAAATASPVNGWQVFASFMALVAISVLLMVVVRRLMRGGATNVSRRSTRVEEADTPSVTFADVAGCDEAIDEMQEMVEFLKNPERFAATGAKGPRGALLVGPPGTGKTLLARAVAGEAGVPFYSTAGSDFTEMYVGVGAKRVRELFAKARTHEDGAIIFIDEIDAVGRARQNSGQAGNQETENTLNALLVELDGFTKSNIIVLAATNRDDILDAALTRPGRLDRKIQVPLPDRLGRLRILTVHADSKPIDATVDLDLIARRTPGMSGAELAQLVNEAATSAARAGRATITAMDFDQAVATVAMGKARTSAVVTEHDRTVTAWHEAGHTVAAMVLPDADKPVSVSIIPRGPAGGVTWMAQGDDLFLTRRRALARLVVAMSGRAAEELLLDGEFTSGPHGDLHAATNTALAMVTQYGMTDTGLMIRSEGLLATGSKMTDETVEAVERLLAEALDTARATLRAHRDVFDAVVAGLLEHDTLTSAQLDEIRGGAVTRPMPFTPAPRDYRRPDAAPVKARTRSRAAQPRRGGVVAAAVAAWRAVRPGRRRSTAD